jgi:hypothetical protein
MVRSVGEPVRRTGDDRGLPEETGSLRPDGREGMEKIRWQSFGGRVLTVEIDSGFPLSWAG